MGYMVSRDDGWRMPGWLWERVEPLLPAPPFHPLGCHAPRVADRDAMDAILLVLRTGIQWNALSATGVCSSSSAHRRFQEWEQAGVFHEIWREGLLDYDANGRYRLVVPLGRWRDDEGAVGWPEDWAQSHGSGEKGAKRSVLSEGAGVPIGLAHDGANRNDQPLLEPTLNSIPIERPMPTSERPQGLCLDRGYDSSPMHDLAVKHGYTPHIRARGEEIKLKAPSRDGAPDAGSSRPRTPG